MSDVFDDTIDPQSITRPTWRASPPSSHRISGLHISEPPHLRCGCCRSIKTTEVTRPRSSDCVTLTARTLNSMCVEPFLVFEQRAKQQRNLPMMISFGTGRKRTGMAQNVAPMLKKCRFVVERLV
jgi:hypothetical protein